MRLPLSALLLVLLAAYPASLAAQPTGTHDGIRLAFPDDHDPYYPGRNTPRLLTPQWVGEDGVECVVVLAIDDMRGPDKWEAFLRPILQRLKKIDGRAPVSIMTCQVDPNHEHLQKWLKESVSLETHTIDHPCPLLQGGDFARAKSTYDRCVDLLAEVPNNRPVAFRVPCCDSLNTPSPRFYAEIFGKTTARGNFLTIDSSVFNLFTANDPELPRDLVLEPDGSERFRKYLPADRGFVNTIEDYPYPYVIGRTCWEFPCVVPSDWSAQHYHKPNNPLTVRDWKAALDATVIKKGVFCLVFHPHGWITSEQIIDLIDHAVTKHGKKVKFLTFREAEERLNKNLLGGHPLRDPKTGADNGVRVTGSAGDRYVSVAVHNDKANKLRTWVQGRDRGGWVTRDPAVAATVLPLAGTALADYPVARRVELGGTPCYVVANDKEQAVFVWSREKNDYVKAPFALPPGARLGGAGKDSGLRIVDLDEDGRDDVVFSNEKEYGVYLFTDLEHGWSKKVIAGKAGEEGALPLIARNGTNNGFFAHSRSLWWQNETTNLLKDHVNRRSFNDLLMQVEPEAKSPEASLRALRPRPGFKAELVACEPLVQSPIAFAWGPDGKLWVVEMGDYPLGVDGKGKPGGRIKFLESTKGDGKYDKATVFLDGLAFPTGVLPWRKGVLVVCAPEIFYAEDTDGDGKADKKVVLYTGFTEGNQQHRVNGPVWGLDNWLYCANGDSGGRVKSVTPLSPRGRGVVGEGGKTVDLRGHDLRIRPDTGDLDLTSGQTQYGRNRDDWGNWFGGNNSNPMWHFALADHYIRRNPHLPPPDPRVPVSVRPGVAPVFPISRTLPRFNDPAAANHFTSACSPIVYRDDLFGPAYADSAFVSEPVHNLVHREVMKAEGVTFKSRRAPDEQTSEFLASSDNWFRPTMTRTGPDGALWVADMYRAVIEHPEWIPKDWQARLDLRAGHDKGRIYRIYPVDQTPRPIPRLDKLDAAGLVAALDSPSGWQRDLAQMMLLWNADKSAVPPLEKLAAESQRPLARLHALCTLDGLDALKPALLLKALSDPQPGVRRHAVRLCEGRFDKSPDLGPALLKLVDDADTQVRMQLACTLGEWDDPRAGAALGRLAASSAGDRYLTAAVLSSVNGKNLDAVLLAALKSGKGPQPAGLVENLLRLAGALGNTSATAMLLKAVGTPEDGKHPAWQFSALGALLDTLDARNSSLAQLGKDEGLKAAVENLSALFAAARKVAPDPKSPPAERAQAVRLLGRGLDRAKEDATLLGELLVPQTPDEVQSAAVAGLGRLRDERVPELLLRGWKGYGPGLRTQVLEVLSRRDEWLRAALEAVEKKQLPAAEIDAVRRQRLLDHRDRAVRERAAKAFAGAANPDRQKVIDAYAAEIAKLPGDAARGQKVFAKTCSVCHKLGGVGNEVGPDLASLNDKSTDYLLTAILDPNRAVEARYVGYVAETKSGLTITGVLIAETGSSVTLVGADGKAQTILRTDLEALASTGKSVMPEGLEKDLPPADLADLVAYVRGAAPKVVPKAFEGNKPEVVKPAADGSLNLTAGNCAIFGPTLVLEKQYGNLGAWSSPEDHAVWTVVVPKTGRYEVSFDYACDNNSGGNTFLLQSGAAKLTGKVAGTGTWDVYKQARVGTLALEAGERQITLRAEGKIKYALIDLRSVRLVPEK
jgi:putative membrane-bound dehydrogenase-like protein